MPRRNRSRVQAGLILLAAGLPIAVVFYGRLTATVFAGEHAAPPSMAPAKWNPWTNEIPEIELQENFPPGQVQEPVPADVDEAIRATFRTVPYRVSQLTNEALKLAVKGATYSANAKLIEVLELIADDLDVEEGTTRHSQSLAAGLTALRESEDIARAGPTSGRAMSIQSRIVGHATPVFRRSDTQQITRIEALEKYFTYASHQLAEAVEGRPEGSAALSHLGRLQPYLTEGDTKSQSLVAARMVALQTAALLADAMNYRAANELGVVMAKQGQLEAARENLIYSADIGRRPETIQSLSVVLHKMGDETGARTMIALANQERRKREQKSRSDRDAETHSLVSWVDHQQFSVRSASAEFQAPPLASPDQTGSKAANSDRPANKPKPWPSWKSKSPARRDSQDDQAAGASGTRKNPPTATDGSLAKAVPARRSGIKTVDYVEGDEATGYPDVTNLPPLGIGHAGDGMLEDSSGFADPVMPQGEYLGLLRTPHLMEYFLHVDDSLSFVFRLNGKPSTEAYRLNVGDVIRITSVTADTLSLETLVQPDGTIVLPQIGSVSAAGKTIDALRRELDLRYGEYFRAPSITVSPVAINRTVEELRSAIINRTSAAVGLPFNSFGQLFNSKVTPHGMISLPAIGNVPAQGLTLDELRREVEARYAEIANGIEVTPVLQQRAPSFIYVLGEVARPGRLDLQAPTSVIQAIGMAGGWNKGGNLNEVIVLRRDKSWHLMATRVKVRPALYNYAELAVDDIWLRDSDIVVVPKLPIQVADDWIELIFTKGIYGVVPFGGISFAFFQDITSLGLLK